MVLLVGKGDPVLTSAYSVKGSGEDSNTEKKVVGGAGPGALIGGIAGGGKGAGIGGLAGTAGGTAIAASKKGGATLDTQRISTRISACTTGDTAGGQVGGV